MAALTSLAGSTQETEEVDSTRDPGERWREPMIWSMTRATSRGDRRDLKTNSDDDTL